MSLIRAQFPPLWFFLQVSTAHQRCLSLILEAGFRSGWSEVAPRSLRRNGTCRGPTPSWSCETGPSPTSTCPATIATVLDNRPIIGSRQILANLDLHAGADNFLRVTLSLPATADNTFEGNASTINYAFTATQRIATR